MPEHRWLDLLEMSCLLSQCPLVWHSWCAQCNAQWDAFLRSLGHLPQIPSPATLQALTQQTALHGQWHYGYSPTSTPVNVLWQSESKQAQDCYYFDTAEQLSIYLMFIHNWDFKLCLFSEKPSLACRLRAHNTLLRHKLHEEYTSHDHLPFKIQN